MNPATEGSIVCLVRHGVTPWNTAARLQGQRDIPLSPEGVRQAERAGQALSQRIAELGRQRWDALYTSPLQRAAQTAQGVARWIGLTPRVDKDLIERSWGAIEGLTREEAETAFPDWQRFPERVAGLEPEEALRARAVAAIERLELAHRGEAIVVVSHGAFIHAFLRGVGLLAPAPAAPMANGAFTIVLRLDGAWQSLAVNDASHLQDELPHTANLSGAVEV